MSSNLQDNYLSVTHGLGHFWYFYVTFSFDLLSLKKMTSFKRAGMVFSQVLVRYSIHGTLLGDNNHTICYKTGNSPGGKLQNDYKPWGFAGKEQQNLKGSPVLALCRRASLLKAAQSP